MVTRADLLNDSRAKIKRAKEHINEFERAERAYISDNAYKVVRTENSDGSVRFDIFVGEAPAPEIACIVGDAAHNLRSALDHIACAIVRLRNPNHLCATSEIKFPIYSTRQQFKSHAGSYKKEAGSGFEKLFEGFQPYISRNNGILDTLENLDLKDKHRMLLLVGQTDLLRADIIVEEGVPDKRFEPDSVGYYYASFFAQAGGGPIEYLDDGVHLTTLSPANARHFPEFQINLRPSGYIAFGETGALRGKPVFTTLVEALQAVENILEAIAPYFV